MKKEIIEITVQYEIEYKDEESRKAVLKNLRGMGAFPGYLPYQITSEDYHAKSLKKIKIKKLKKEES